MRNRVISILLGAALGIIPSYGAYQSQYLKYVPRQQVSISDLQCSQTIEYDPVEDKEDDTGQEASYNPDHILREDTIVHYDPDIPYEIQESAQVYGERYDICPEFLEAVAFAESSYIPEVSNGSCIGLMQINMDCRDQLERMDKLGLSESDMYKVDASMIVAADYLRELFEKYEDPAEVLMRYNGDRTGLKKYKKTGEISAYAEKILDLSAELEKKHGK